jgi:hypothetical protein
VLGVLAPTAVRRVHVPLLSRDAVAELAGAPADDLYVATAGNAFFVTEAIAAGGSLPPPSVRDAVLARAAKLTAEARTTLELVAVVPGAAELWLVRAAGVADGLAACEERGLLAVEGGVVRYRHELARRVIEESLSGGRRAELHGRVLDALLSWDVDPARLVHHAVEAGDPAMIVELSMRAGRAAAESRAHAEAAAHYARVLDHTELLDASARAEVLEAFAVESYPAGRADPALAACHVRSRCDGPPATRPGSPTPCACSRGCSGGRAATARRRRRRVTRPSSSSSRSARAPLWRSPTPTAPSCSCWRSGTRRR